MENVCYFSVSYTEIHHHQLIKRLSAHLSNEFNMSGHDCHGKLCPCPKCSSPGAISCLCSALIISNCTSSIQRDAGGASKGHIFSFCYLLKAAALCAPKAILKLSQICIEIPIIQLHPHWFIYCDSKLISTWLGRNLFGRRDEKHTDFSDFSKPQETLQQVHGEPVHVFNQVADSKSSRNPVFSYPDCLKAHIAWYKDSCAVYQVSSQPVNQFCPRWQAAFILNLAASH